jgi:hypothetical protein
MSFELISEVNNSVHEKDKETIAWWENFAKVVTEAEEYAKEHGKPLRDILKEFGPFGPRSDADIARLSGGPTDDTSIAAKDPSIRRHPDSKGAKLAGEREFSQEREPVVPQVGQEVMVKDTKGNMALFTVKSNLPSDVELKPKAPLLRGARKIYSRINKLSNTQGFVQNPEDENRFSVTIM